MSDKAGRGEKRGGPSTARGTAGGASVSALSGVRRGSPRYTMPRGRSLVAIAWGLCAVLLLLPCTSGYASWQGQKKWSVERRGAQGLGQGQGQGQEQVQQHGPGRGQGGGEQQQQGLGLSKSQRQRRFKWTMRPVFGLVPQPRFIAQSVFESYATLAALTTELDSTLYSALEMEDPSSGAPSAEGTPQAHSGGAALQGTAVASLPSEGAQRQAEGAQEQTEGQSRGRRLKEGDLPSVSIGGVPLPLLQAYNNSYSNGTYIPLAVNRTYRYDPLNRTYYAGGWDFFATGYWSSLAWSTVYGAAAGIAWAIFGLGFVFVLLCMCLCCGENWGSLRDPSLKYSKRELLLPLILMLVGFAIAGAGLGVTIAGAVQFNGAAQNLTSFAVTEVDKVTDLVLNVTGILSSANSTGSTIHYNFPPKVQKRFSEVLGKADAVAASVKEGAREGGDAVDKTLNTLQTVIFVLGCITFGFIVLGLVCGLCKWLVPSNIVTTLLWLIIVATWVAVTVFVFVWTFEGDTSEAMHEVAGNYSARTALSRIIPCADPSVTANLGAFTRYMGYTTVVLVNRTIVKSAPQVFAKVLKTPHGLCNPFGPAPMYKFDNTTCFKPQKPCNKNKTKGHKCPPRVIDYPTLITKVSDIQCPQNTAGKACVTTDLATLIYAGELVVLNIGTILPELKKIFRCAYIRFLAENISTNTDEMQSSATLLWVGFLLISVGSMIFALALPWYAFRTVRCYGDHEGDVEEGEWDEYEGKPDDGYDYNYDNEHDREDDEEGEEEDEDDDHPKGKHRRDDSDNNGYSDEDDHKDRRRRDDDGSEEHSDNYDDRESDRYDDDESDRGSRRGTRR